MRRYTSAVGQNDSQLTVSAGCTRPRPGTCGPAQKINGKEPPAMVNVEALAAAAQSSGGNPYLFPIIIVALFALLYFVMIRPQRNRQRATQQTQNQVVPASGSAPPLACTRPWSRSRTPTWCSRSLPVSTSGTCGGDHGRGPQRH